MTSKHRERYSRLLISRGGGMINCGHNLGVFLAPAECDKRCPAGWVFVAVETATVEIVSEAINCASAGRANWPEPDMA